MNNFNSITEKIYSIQAKWIKKTMIKWAPFITFFIALMLTFNISDNKFSFTIFAITYLSAIIVVSFIIYLYLTLSRRNFYYEFGEKLITLRQGIISKSERQFLYGRIQHVLLSQDFLDRLMGLASISLETASEGAGAKFAKEEGPPHAILGFASNEIRIPGLLYENALDFRDRVLKLIEMNPIDDAQSGL